MNVHAFRFLPIPYPLINEKLLRRVQGGGFLEKSPLAAGGKETYLAML